MLTVTIDVSLDEYEYVGDGYAFDGLFLTAISSVAFTFSDISLADMLINSVFTGSVTLTKQVALIDESSDEATVIVVCPNFKAVTNPEVDTVATFVFDDDQTKLFDELDGLAVADN